MMWGACVSKNNKNMENRKEQKGTFVPVKLFVLGIRWNAETKSYTCSVTVQKPVWLLEDDLARLKFERSIVVEVQGFLP